MKKVYVVILAALWLMALVKFIDNSGNKEADIVTAFANDSYLSTNSSIEAVIYAGNLYYSDEAKKDVLIKLAKELGITEGYTVENCTENANSVVKYVKNSKYAVTEIKFVTVKNDKDEMVSRQYIMVNIEILNSIESAVLYRERVETILAGMDMEAEVTMTLKGNINGKLSSSEKDVISNDIIASLGGEIVSEYREEKLYTVYAYTGKIDDYVIVGKDKININVAINYDELLDETNIYMATPIINEDY